MVKWVMRNLLRGNCKLVAGLGVKPAPFSPSSFQEGVLRGNSRELVPKGISFLFVIALLRYSLHIAYCTVKVSF